MLYNIDWNIEFNNESLKTRLAFMAELQIVRDVDNLASTATIVLPETIMNSPLHYEYKINEGTAVIIELGYNGNLKREFTGFIKEIRVIDGSIKIECEDALYLFRKHIADKELNSAGLNQICQYVIDEIDSSYQLDSNYNISYEKFSIYAASGYDVLKKLQEETKANISFDTENRILRVQAPYKDKTGEVFYVMQKNVEKSSLEYKNNQNKKLKVNVETTDNAGNIQKAERGESGGDSLTLKVGTMAKDSIERVAAELYNREIKPGYKGSFDTWLIPYVEPNYSAHIKDEDYPDKTGLYFIKSVTTKLSSSGGIRTITPGLRLS